MKLAKQLESNFIETVKFQTKLALLKKEDLKKKRAIRTLKLLETCNGWTSHKEKFKQTKQINREGLLAEILYLRATVAPDIRQKRRVKTDGKLKMVNFTINELSIKNAVKPENNIIVSVSELLMDSFK